MDSSVALAAAAVALILILILLSVLKKQIQPGKSIVWIQSWKQQFETTVWMFTENVGNVDEPAQQEVGPGVRRAVAGRNNRLRNRFANRNQENAAMGNFAGLSEFIEKIITIVFETSKVWDLLKSRSQWWSNSLLYHKNCLLEIHREKFGILNLLDLKFARIQLLMVAITMIYI